jgi:hypothetical protein
VPLPEEDVTRVRNFVDALNADMPAHAASQLRYRLDVHRNTLTVVECRSMDPDAPTDTWFDVFVARLRFMRSRGWELYWPDRDSKFHIYQDAGPTQDVTLLIDEINRDPTGIFFG